MEEHLSSSPRKHLQMVTTQLQSQINELKEEVKRLKSSE